MISSSDGQALATLPREVEFTGVASGYLEGLHLARQGLQQIKPVILV